MVKGDIYLARIPFGGTSGFKVRPVLLLTVPLGPVPEVFAAYLSSVVPSPLLTTDYVSDPQLPKLASANVKTISVVRLHKLAALHQRDVIRRLGILAPACMAEIDSRLRALLNL